MLINKANRTAAIFYDTADEVIRKFINITAAELTGTTNHTTKALPTINDNYKNQKQ